MCFPEIQNREKVTRIQKQQQKNTAHERTSKKGANNLTTSHSSFFSVHRNITKDTKLTLFFFITYCLQKRSTKKAASQQNTTKIEKPKKIKPNQYKKKKTKKRKHSKKIKVSIYCDHIFIVFFLVFEYNYT